MPLSPRLLLRLGVPRDGNAALAREIAQSSGSLERRDHELGVSAHCPSSSRRSSASARARRSRLRVSRRSAGRARRECCHGAVGKRSAGAFSGSRRYFMMPSGRRSRITPPRERELDGFSLETRRPQRDSGPTAGESGGSCALVGHRLQTGRSKVGNDCVGQNTFRHDSDRKIDRGTTRARVWSGVALEPRSHRSQPSERNSHHEPTHRGPIG